MLMGLFDFSKLFDFGWIKIMSYLQISLSWTMFTIIMGQRLLYMLTALIKNVMQDNIILE